MPSLTFNLFKNQTTPTLWMNHLIVIYALLLPISKYANSFIFFLILTLFIIRGNFKEHLTPVVKNKIIQAFVLFFIVHILWLYGTENFSQAKLAISFAKYSLFPIIFFSFLDRRFSYFVISAFTIGILYSELISYFIQLDILPLSLELYKIPIYACPGDSSPFLDHSQYSTSLAFVASLLFFTFLTRASENYRKLLELFFIFSISINLFLNGGRIGYLLYLVLLTYVIIFIYGKTLLKPALITLIGIFSFFYLAYLYSPLFQSRTIQTMDEISALQNNRDFSTAIGARIGFTYYAKDVIMHHPFFGVGTGDYMDEVKKIIPDIPSNHFMKYTMGHPHNIYTMLLLQFGIIGLMVYFNIFYQIYRSKSHEEYLNFVKYSILLTFFIALITETFLDRFYLPLFVLIISAVFAGRKLPENIKLTLSKKTIFMYFILLLLATLNAKLQFIIQILRTYING